MPQTVGNWQQTLITVPQNGDDLDADVVRAQFNNLRDRLNGHDADSALHIQAGLDADRPAPGIVGRRWWATDTGRLYREDGATWSEVDYLSRTAGGTITGSLITNGPLVANNAVQINATLTADFIAGDGSLITGINADNISAGTLPDARFPATLPAVSGALLTGLNASNIASGTLDDARLSSNVARLDTAQFWSAAQTFTAGIVSRRANAGDLTFNARLTADGQPRFQIAANGKLSFGDGTAGVDTNLYRSAANVLRTDDSFVVGDLLTVLGTQLNVRGLTYNWPSAMGVGVLTNDGAGNLSWVPGGGGGGGGIGGAGTAGRIPLWAGVSTLTDSVMTQSGSNITLAGSLTVTSGINGDLSGNATAAYQLVFGRTISLAGHLSGNATFNGSANISIAAAIQSNVITNAMINSAAAIEDTKLATIATAGKVANSATTATSANTANAIVARDASGNFSAGTLSLSGNLNVRGVSLVWPTANSGGVLTNDGAGNLSWAPPGGGGGGVGGSGTENRLARWASASDLTESTISDTGSAITLGAWTSNTIAFVGRITGNVLPSTDLSVQLGSISLRFGLAYINELIHQGPVYSYQAGPLLLAPSTMVYDFGAFYHPDGAYRVVCVQDGGLALATAMVSFRAGTGVAVFPGPGTSGNVLQASGNTVQTGAWAVNANYRIFVHRMA